MPRQFLAAAVGLAICQSAFAQTPASAGAETAILVKEGANIDGLHPALRAALPAIIATWKACKLDLPVVTSGIDSFDAHRPNSRHQHGRAIDVRGRSHTPADVRCIQQELPKRLPANFGAEGRFQLIWETPATHRTNAPHWHLAFVEIAIARMTKITPVASMAE